MQALSPTFRSGGSLRPKGVITRISTTTCPTTICAASIILVYADYYIHADNYADAMPFLLEAVKGAKGSQKTRLNFLLGQVYASLGEKEKAYKAFAAAVRRRHRIAPSSTLASSRARSLQGADKAGSEGPQTHERY